MFFLFVPVTGSVAAGFCAVERRAGSVTAGIGHARGVADEGRSRIVPADYCSPAQFDRAEPDNWHDGPDDSPLHREASRRFAGFAHQVRKSREALGWNQKRLANEVGASERTIRDLETGASFLSGSLLMRVAAVLQLDTALARDWDAGKPRGRDDLERHHRRPRPANGRSPS